MEKQRLLELCKVVREDCNKFMDASKRIEKAQMEQMLILVDLMTKVRELEKDALD